MLGMWIQASLSVNTLQYYYYLHGSWTCGSTGKCRAGFQTKMFLWMALTSHWLLDRTGYSQEVKRELLTQHCAEIATNTLQFLWSAISDRLFKCSVSSILLLTALSGSQVIPSELPSEPWFSYGVGTREVMKSGGFYVCMCAHCPYCQGV